MNLLEAEQYLARIEERYPGSSLELRIPDVGVINILEGVNHRRGNPANVVEIGAVYFIMLCKGEVKYRDALEAGWIISSGNRSDISFIFDELSNNQINFN